MASSRKSAPEKKTKQTKKKLSKTKIAKRKNARNNKKLSNGGVSNSEVQIPSSLSSDTQHEEENRVEITSTPTSSKRMPNGKQKGKRKIEGEVEEEEVKMNLFLMERIQRIGKFLEKFCEEAYTVKISLITSWLTCSQLEGESSVVSKQKRYVFLSSKDALAERKLVKPEEA
ncbi:hypothetical protein UlMin_001771 [Ulmus minor]